MPTKESIDVILEVSRTDVKSLASFSLSAPSKYSRVLDLLLHVQHHIDSTLSFRYSCRAGMCGSCAVVINGKEGLACQTTIGSLGSRKIRVEPMRALPVIRDVICDLEPFFLTFKKSHSALIAKNPNQNTLQIMPPHEAKRKTIQNQNGCITCGSCFSACEWSATKKGYLGPAALNRVLMLALDERDQIGKARLNGIATEQGVLRCHGLGNCSIVCPAGIPLQEGMTRLKNMIAQGPLVCE